MSLLAVLLSLLIFVASGFGAHTKVKVDSGQDATLQCQGPTDEEITLLEWTKPDLSSDEYLLFFRNKRAFEKYQHESFRGRVALRDPSMKDGDASVILRNTRTSDAGTYECLITTSRSGSGLNESKHTVDLTVKASGVVNGRHQDGSLSLTAALFVPCVSLLLL